MRKTEAAPVITHNEAASRFEVKVEGQLAMLEYERTPEALSLVHTEVPEVAEGQGIGGALARTALEYARREQLRVEPSCRFVAAYIRRHPEYAELVTTGGS